MATCCSGHSSGTVTIDSLLFQGTNNLSVELLLDTVGRNADGSLNVMESLPEPACIGPMSMGSLLLCAGAPGKRFCLPNARIMIHQPSGGAQGQATDIEIHAKEIIDIRRRLDEIIAQHTKQPYEKVRTDTERDYFLSSEEAQTYGIIDRVIHNITGGRK